MFNLKGYYKGMWEGFHMRTKKEKLRDTEMWGSCDILLDKYFFKISNIIFPQNLASSNF